MVSDTGILVNNFFYIERTHEQFIGIRNIFKTRNKEAGAIYSIIMGGGGNFCQYFYVLS